MRFLANENFPGTAVAALIAAGHDVVWMRNAAPGMSDPDVLAWAKRDERILLTFDKDFGELARVSALPSTCGVVLFRMPMQNPRDIGSRLSRMVESRDDSAGHFSVIEPGRTRMRPLRQRAGP
jgi:predicted nuclease of predicted toxin-antitoxin system